MPRRTVREQRNKREDPKALPDVSPEFVADRGWDGVDDLVDDVRRQRAVVALVDGPVARLRGVEDVLREEAVQRPQFRVPVRGEVRFVIRRARVGIDCECVELTHDILLCLDDIERRARREWQSGTAPKRAAAQRGVGEPIFLLARRGPSKLRYRPRLANMKIGGTAHP